MTKTLLNEDLMTYTLTTMAYHASSIVKTADIDMLSDGKTRELSFKFLYSSDGTMENISNVRLTEGDK